MATSNENEQPDKPAVEVIARFAKCTWCGSTDRMMGRLGKEMEEQGLIGEGMDVGTHEIGGPIIDPNKVSQMLSASLRSGMFALQDICVGCGRQITVKIEKRLTMVGIGQAPGMGGMGRG